MRLLFVVALLAPTALVAQNAVEPGTTPVSTYGHRIAVPRAMATRRASPIVLDAKLDEPAWRAAT